MQVVYNDNHSGFRVSEEALKRLAELGIEADKWGYLDNVPRHDPRLIHVLRELGDKANGKFAELRIFEPDDDRYWIEEYDGKETVHTPSNMEWIVVDKNDDL